MSVSCTGAINVTDVSATLQGTGTNVPANHDLDFWYGTTPGGPYPTYVATGIAGNNTPAQSVSFGISGLTLGTTYYFNMLEAPDIDVSQECSFTTLAAPPAVDYSVECLAVDPPTQTGGQLNGHAVDVPANQTVGFHYGTTPGGPYPISIADGFFGNGPATTVSWAHNLTGLTCNTTYYYQAEVYDVDGITVVDNSTECSFTTTACPVAPPVDYNVNCSSILVTQTGATIGGSANNVPNDHTLQLGWGTIPGGPYPNNINDGFFGSGDPNPQIWNHNLSGLTCNTTYYFRAEVYDAANALVDFSTECSFVTAACSALPPITVDCDSDSITSNSAHFFCTVTNAPLGSVFKCRFGNTLGGPYTTTIVSATVGNNGVQFLQETLSGLAPNTPYYCVYEVYSPDGTTVIGTSNECNFTTLNATLNNPVVSCGMLFDQSECVQINVGGRPVWVCIRPGWGLEGQ